MFKYFAPILFFLVCLIPLAFAKTSSDVMTKDVQAWIEQIEQNYSVDIQSGTPIMKDLKQGRQITLPDLVITQSVTGLNVAIKSITFILMQTDTIEVKDTDDIDRYVLNILAQGLSVDHKVFQMKLDRLTAETKYTDLFARNLQGVDGYIESLFKIPAFSNAPLYGGDISSMRDVFNRAPLSALDLLSDITFSNLTYTLKTDNADALPIVMHVRRGQGTQELLNLPSDTAEAKSLYHFGPITYENIDADLVSYLPTAIQSTSSLTKMPVKTVVALLEALSENLNDQDIWPEMLAQIPDVFARHGTHFNLSDTSLVAPKWRIDFESDLIAASEPALYATGHYTMKVENMDQMIRDLQTVLSETDHPQLAGVAPFIGRIFFGLKALQTFGDLQEDGKTRLYKITLSEDGEVALNGVQMTLLMSLLSF